ncbi:hypothetical protein [Kitasatospora sp. McL0602]|uniref:hypothetical protein n=1 Tax=Kitasatospora sp. McL0602 TaxID=3439530 RepID=UPI003F899EDA
MLDPERMLTSRDWSRTITEFQGAGAPAVLVLDGLFTAAGVDALRRELADDSPWEEFDTARRRNRPQGRAFIRAGTELGRALRPLVGTMKIISYWVIASTHGPGIRMHADNSTYSMNIWLSPDPQDSTAEQDGMRFYDVLRPERMPYAQFSSHDACEEYVRERGGAVTRRVPYRCNRAVLFDARVMHRSEPVSFPGGSLLDSRINLTYSWDHLAWARERTVVSG